VEDQESYVSPIEFVERVFPNKIHRDNKGKVKNRSTVYALVARLPDECKSQLGSSILVKVTRSQRWLNEGGDRELAV